MSRSPTKELLQIQVKPALKEALKKKAKREGETLSTLVRRTLEASL
jgi:predicted HicB family RNase H-like nuclease